jgi:hypothetical protein
MLRRHVVREENFVRRRGQSLKSSSNGVVGCFGQLNLNLQVQSVRLGVDAVMSLGVINK